MKSQTFPQFNIDLGAGNNPNTVNLPVAIATSPAEVYKDVAFCVSRFKLSQEELDTINKRGEIWLSVMTSRPVAELDGRIKVTGTMPPVIISVDNPFEDWGEENLKAYDAVDFLPYCPPY